MQTWSSSRISALRNTSWIYITQVRFTQTNASMETNPDRLVCIPKKSIYLLLQFIEMSIKCFSHRRMDRLFAPISWQPCWIPEMRYGANLCIEPLSWTEPDTPWATFTLSPSLKYTNINPSLSSKCNTTKCTFPSINIFMYTWIYVTVMCPRLSYIINKNSHNWIKKKLKIHKGWGIGWSNKKY